MRCSPLCTAWAFRTFAAAWGGHFFCNAINQCKIKTYAHIFNKVKGMGASAVGKDRNYLIGKIPLFSDLKLH